MSNVCCQRPEPQEFQVSTNRPGCFRDSIFICLQDKKDYFREDEEEAIVLLISFTSQHFDGQDFWPFTGRGR